ncbi:MAG: 30S ribosomal protein S4 [Patescibacteria group bacterium]|nr:30S ribosomal protein S4 [Patescibacteria group bacterium]MDE1988414.1 30S ribosomal protein S4 [Patescibacteria group bacterium]MDE2217959.1 30S ribosomal protein S4 [Patescibacteria group bacterium]
MLIGPRYKKAKKLGAHIFDKTQTQKFALRQSMGKKDDKKRGRPKTDFGLQLLEKQKARFTYGVNERQFSKYVKSIINKKGANSPDTLVQILESRLDNVVYRLGLANSRQAARQMVSHGHITINGRRNNIPSYGVIVGDKIGVSQRSLKNKLFADLENKIKEHNYPSWLKYDAAKKSYDVQGMPKLANTEIMFNAASVIQFYSR